MDLFDKFSSVRAAVSSVVGPNPFTMTVDELRSPGEVVMNGRPTLMFGSNNYLGLTTDPQVVAAGVEALERWGSGTTGSRVANGTTVLHRRLEAALAAAFGVPHASIFTTGHQANLSAIAGLCGRDDVLLIDAESHASIFDATRLSGATTVVFRHNDPADLARKLRRLPAGETNRLVVVEGLYSTSGDVAPLRDLVEVSRAGGAYLLVDEAHSFGVYGRRGLGCADAQGVLATVDVVVGTFSKSLGGVGGFCVSRHEALDLLRFTARAYLFTASSSAATVATAHAALVRVLDADELRARLWRNVRRFRAGLERLGLAIGPDESPIVAIQSGSAADTMVLWRRLLESGVYVNLVLPPACPPDRCRLRASVTAAHGDADLDLALDRFASAVAAVELDA